MGTKLSEALREHRESIRQIVLNNHAKNVRVFGSVVRGDDDETSDLDLLIDPTPETTLVDIGAIAEKISALLGVDVDVLTPNALPEKFRASVLAEAEPV